MIIDNCYVVMPETAEEVKLMNDAILKYREEKQRQETIQVCKNAIFLTITNVIDTVGLATTKTIVRELNRELREMKEDE